MRCGAGAGCEALCDSFDLLLLLSFLANTGTAKRNKADASTKNTNVICGWFFGLNIILLLSFYQFTYFCSVYKRQIFEQ